MTEKTHPSVGGGEKAEPLFKKSWSEVANFVYNADTDGIPAAWFDSQWPTDFGARVFDDDNLQPIKAASIFDNTNLGVSKAADIAYHSNLSVSKDAEIFNHTNLGVSRAADITYQSELQPVKFGDVFDHANLSSDKATDIVYHDNFNLPSTEARDKVAESTYGIAKDGVTGIKGFTYQINEKRDFAFRTETPNHAYWHRMYNTPAAFETVYQDYTTSIQKKGTTPSKSAPGTADPNPQPGACWSVSLLPDGTQIGGFASPAPDARGATFDGTYLWILANTPCYVYQVDKAGNTTGKGFATPAGDPRGLAWDGQYLWHGDDAALYIYQQATDGTQIGGFATPGDNPEGVTWDGTYLGIACYGTGTIYRMFPDGTLFEQVATPWKNPWGLTWDGTYYWNANDSDQVYQLTKGGTQVSFFNVPDHAGHEAWDGMYLWEAGHLSDYVYQWGSAGNLDVNYRIFAK